MAQAVSLLLKLFGALFLGILGLLGLGFWTVKKAMDNEQVRKIVIDGMVDIASDVLFPNGPTTKYPKAEGPFQSKNNRS